MQKIVVTATEKKRRQNLLFVRFWHETRVVQKYLNAS